MNPGETETPSLGNKVGVPQIRVYSCFASRSCWGKILRVGRSDMAPPARAIGLMAVLLAPKHVVRAESGMLVLV